MDEVLLEYKNVLIVVLFSSGIHGKEINISLQETIKNHSLCLTVYVVLCM